MRLTYKVTESLIGVPYVPAEREYDRPNLGYFDLKRKPELMENVPELQDVPELKSLVRELNHPRSIVRSLSCERGMGPNSGDPIITTKLTSFVRLCFEIPQWNGAADNYRHLYENFERYVKTLDPGLEYTIIDFEVDFASYNNHGYKGRALTIWPNGYGPDESQARSNWAIGVQVTERFFALQRDAFQSELDKGQVNIS